MEIMLRETVKRRCILAPALLLLCFPMWAQAEDIKVVCPKNTPKPPVIERQDVYKDSPFKAGESATYEVRWAGTKVGYGTIEVRKPLKHKDIWHRVFHVKASTGDWFKGVLVAKEEMESYSRPWDFGVSRFYMSQNEGKIFSKPFVQDKWLDFDHAGCKVSERLQVPGKPEQNNSFDLAPGAVDALGVIYALRSKTYKLKQAERIPVYTSEKNWWLEATPVAFETVEVPAGKFKAAKLKLQTFIGKDLQQKGEVHVWIATETPQKQLVQVQADIKLGKVWIKLDKFEAGSN